MLAMEFLETDNSAVKWLLHLFEINLRCGTRTISDVIHTKIVFLFQKTEQKIEKIQTLDF